MEKKNNPKTKIITILGPTSSGKSDVAVLIAKKVNGEIISADSRQVYRGMNIGTGKVTKKEMCGIPHYLLDIISPKKIFTVSDFKNLAEKAINIITKKGKVPVICGGTGLYINSLLDNWSIPNVPPNKKLRKELENKTKDELFKILSKIDPRRANNIDAKNPVRLIRAIEIAKAIGRTPELKKSERFETLRIGLYPGKEILEGRIRIRLIKRIRSGMVSEVKKIKKSGVTWKRLNDFGLEYRHVSKYLRGLKNSQKANVRPTTEGGLGKLSKEEMLKRLESEIIKYSKRQMTWFRKDKKVIWFDPVRDKNKIIKISENFLKDSL